MAARARTGKKTKGSEYPIVLLESTVVFPNDVVSIQLADEDPLGSLIEGREGELVVATAFARGTAKKPRRLEQLRPVCVLCRVVQSMQLPGGGLQAVFQGIRRAQLVDVRQEGAATYVRAVDLPADDPDSPETSGPMLEVLDLIGEYLPRDGTYPDDLESILRMNLRGPGRFADLVAAYLNLPLPIKREAAVETDARARLDRLARAIECELARCSVESDIHKRVRHQIEDRQREQYLRQQMRAIRRELGEDGLADGECDELAERATKARLPKHAREVVEREIRRLRSVSPSSAEHQVIRTYVGWLLDLPWRKRTRDRLDLKRARAILDRDHSGLRKVKERILEHLAVRKLKKDLRGPVLCLVGPPGVGKTSLGKAVAEALGRKFSRMSVGGLRDEAEIRGHRRTYVGAMPGKVIQLIKGTGVRNPVLQIDEIDKMGADARGDPASAVLELLDTECNREFRDHYVDVDFDLGEVFFLVTANLLDPIPPALRDRLEVIRIGGYTREEKLLIARRHLVPRAIEGNGLETRQVHFTSAGLGRIIDGHTREAGLRELDRSLHRVCRKAATRYVEGDTTQVTVGKRGVRDFLGPAPYAPDLAGRRPEVGVATGLAWTAYGGAILTIEATRMAGGKGRIQVTGHLGEVMQESARTAFSFVRANCDEFDVDPQVFRDSDIHIHFPEGATPKDGPSAGVAIATCLASLFTGRAVRHDVAMTGELTLKGKVLAVGGIKEKLLVAYRAGIQRVLIPAGNLKDLEDVPEEIRRKLDVVGTEDVVTNICEALLSIVVPEGGVLEVDPDRALHVSGQTGLARRACS